MKKEEKRKPFLERVHKRRPTLGRLRSRLFTKQDRQDYDIMQRAIALKAICVDHANKTLRTISDKADKHDLKVSRCHFPLKDVQSGNISKQSRSLYEFLAWYARDRELI